ncbi:MAG: class I SAM-dependent methyltransferase [Sinobacteraceae bacterium]|nr:class I SAM-dependent methyltransferase [Nevskiaceae bacterium]
MGFYARHVLPRLLEAAMHDPRLGRHRAPVVGGARGRILEIGFGTGANLPYYPSDVRRIDIVEPDAMLSQRARRHIADSGRDVITHALSAERLPFSSDSFDTVISTFTLCSIAQADLALAEIRRILHPDGRFLFLEHGRAPDPRIAAWQHRLTPLQKRVGGGCHLDRPIRTLIEQAGFAVDVELVEERYVERLPRIVGWFTSGAATPQKPNQWKDDSQ